MDKFEVMKMLVEVVDKGSFSSASRSLNVPTTTLSRKISDMESQIGTRLLIRTTRKLSLTDAGASYVVAARSILKQVEAAESEAAGEYITPKGELVITAPSMFGRLFVLPVIAEFLNQFPDVTVKLLLTDRNTDLVAEQVDMAVRIGALPDSSMVATPVGTMRTVTCGHPSLFAAHGLPLKPGDLFNLPAITIDTPMPSANWYYSPDLQASRPVAVRRRLAVSTPEAAAHAATLGAGVARLLHYQVASAVAAGELEIVLDSFEPTPSPIHLLHASRGLMPLKMRRFLDYAAPRLRALLAP